jgi:Ca-activated chloride channel family protein
LGASLIKEGISVSTIGLGLDYNEDLMSRLAAKSDGTVYFAEKARDLVKVFDQEFGRALSAVAQEIQTEIRCAPGVRPVRVLGREGEIHGQNVQVFINNLYGGREKSIVLEVEVQSGAQGATRKIAWVSVRYDNMMTRKADELTREIEASFTASKSLIEERTNAKVMVDVVKLIASEQSMLAMRLRDKGKIEEAKAALASNRAILYENADRFNSPELRGQAMQNDEDDRNLEGEKWKGQRKQMQKDYNWQVSQ